jgi:hypothetical protein
MTKLFVVNEYDSKMSAVIGTGSRTLLFCVVISLAGMCIGVGK